MYGLFSIFACKQEKKTIRVEFILETPTLNDTTPVFITGNHPSLGNWDPSLVKMMPAESGKRKLTLEFNKAQVLEYKYTLGSWDKEACDSSGKAPGNYMIKPYSDTTMMTKITNWKKDNNVVINGQITGMVKYHTKIKGDSIKPRDVIVWLPPDYDKNTKKRYPVLYMHDGQNIFDPKTASFKVDWQLDETADSLIRMKKMRPVIIVGIYNTSDRMQEYCPTTKGKAYRDFVVKKVKPMIDSLYRTMPDRENTAVGGSSAGGLVSFMLLWENETVFSKAICMSPAFKIEVIDYVKEVEKYTGKKKDIKIYIDNGGIDLETRLQPGVDDMIKALDKKGYKKDKDYFVVIDKNAAHTESEWAKRMPFPLTLFFPVK
jgi:predicted alpha/beta superfamily hydrolase